MIEYIESFTIQHGKYIVTFLFGEEEGKNEFALTPALAKALNIDLTKTIKKFEKKFGKISIDEIKVPEDEKISKKEEYS